MNNPNVILAAVGVREKQNALFGGRADGDEPPLIQGMIRIVERHLVLLEICRGSERALKIAAKAAKKYRNALRENWPSESWRTADGSRGGSAELSSMSSTTTNSENMEGCQELETDLATLAAAYGFGLVKNHPYRDGNKRVGCSLLPRSSESMGTI